MLRQNSWDRQFASSERIVTGRLCVIVVSTPPDTPSALKGPKTGPVRGVMVNETEEQVAVRKQASTKHRAPKPAMARTYAFMMLKRV